MAKKLKTYVHVRDDRGVSHEFGPDDDLPGWAEKAIENPDVWAGDGDDETEPTPGPSQRVGQSAAPASSDVGSGPLSGRKVGQLKALAEANDLDAGGTKSELVDRLEAAGVQPGATNTDTNVSA